MPVTLVPQSAPKSWVQFIRGEREHFSDFDSNRVGFAGANVLRYYDFLIAILGRHERASRGFLESFERVKRAMELNDPVATNRELDRLWPGHNEAMMTLQLEIESFYLFAKLFLDKIALFIQLYFGQVRKLPLHSHSDLQKNLETFAAQNKIELAPGWKAMLDGLEEHIVHFRDKQITHDKNLRAMRGISVTSDGATTMRIGHLYPLPTDKGLASTNLADLMHRIDGYVDFVVALVEANRDRSRLNRKS